MSIVAYNHRMQLLTLTVTVVNYYDIDMGYWHLSTLENHWHSKFEESAIYIRWTEKVGTLAEDKLEKQLYLSLSFFCLFRRDGHIPLELLHLPALRLCVGLVPGHFVLQVVLLPLHPVTAANIWISQAPSSRCYDRGSKKPAKFKTCLSSSTVFCCWSRMLSVSLCISLSLSFRPISNFLTFSSRANLSIDSFSWVDEGRFLPWSLSNCLLSLASLWFSFSRAAFFSRNSSSFFAASSSTDPDLPEEIFMWLENHCLRSIFYLHIVSIQR